jgi:hypothetical protein
VKQGGDILVCLGNPPYDRVQRAEDGTKPNKGGWVLLGDRGQGKIDLKTATVEGGDHKERPIFEDFLEPSRKSGKGLHLQVIFNDYVYFWRWALWRPFEQQACGGILSFITASSYLSGPGFAGMREVLRRTFDELWIIDLGGDNLGARKTPNVFAIQIPVAIAMGTRGTEPNPATPAKVWYAKIEALSRDAKLNLIANVDDLASLEWKLCPDDWQAPLRPQGAGAFFDWPKLTDLFPYHTAGAVFYRTWPIGETEEVLVRRWATLRTAAKDDKARLFKESRDRKVSHTVGADDLPGFAQPAVRDLTPTTPEPKRVRYSFRVLDRQFAYFDFRLGDYIRPSLFRMASDKQVFLVAPDSMVPGLGPAIAVATHVPDQHFFRGSFGGKDVIPLFRDAAGTVPNITAGLLDDLGDVYGAVPSTEDFAAYVYALLGGQSYTRRFWNELETPGPRVPLTKDADAFAQGVKLGRRLIWLHTYAERFRGEGQGDEVPQGAARIVKGVSAAPQDYPTDYRYDGVASEIVIEAGASVISAGRLGPVAPEVWSSSSLASFIALICLMSWFALARLKPASMRFHGSFVRRASPRSAIFRAAGPSWMVGMRLKPRAASERWEIIDPRP